MHMPPPVHGAAMTGKAIKNSELFSSLFDSCYGNIANAHSRQYIAKDEIRVKSGMNMA